MSRTQRSANEVNGALQNLDPGFYFSGSWAPNQQRSIPLRFMLRSIRGT